MSNSASATVLILNTENGQVTLSFDSYIEDKEIMTFEAISFGNVSLNLFEAKQMFENFIEMQEKVNQEDKGEFYSWGSGQATYQDRIIQIKEESDGELFNLTPEQMIQVSTKIKELNPSIQYFG